MRALAACALSMALIPTTALSASDSINCKEFATEQLQEIKKEYYGVLSRDEAALAFEVAERSCRTLTSGAIELPANTIEIQTEKKREPRWWEGFGENGDAVPLLKRRQQQGGK